MGGLPGHAIFLIRKHGCGEHFLGFVGGDPHMSYGGFEASGNGAWQLRVEVLDVYLGLKCRFNLI
jgi:hypothetical protein